MHAALQLLPTLSTLPGGCTSGAADPSRSVPKPPRSPAAPRAGGGGWGGGGGAGAEAGGGAGGGGGGAWGGGVTYPPGRARSPTPRGPRRLGAGGRAVQALPNKQSAMISLFSLLEPAAVASPGRSLLSPAPPRSRALSFICLPHPAPPSSSCLWPQ